jgi:hypothetical protein
LEPLGVGVLERPLEGGLANSVEPPVRLALALLLLPPPLLRPARPLSLVVFIVPLLLGEEVLHEVDVWW